MNENKECEEFGIVHSINERWEKGIEHHPKAEYILKLLRDSDWLFGNDYFCWKKGGDGDNGETLLYSLSVLLELKDAQALNKVIQCFNCNWEGTIEDCELYEDCDEVDEQYHTVAFCPNCESGDNIWRGSMRLPSNIEEGIK